MPFARFDDSGVAGEVLGHMDARPVFGEESGDRGALVEANLRDEPASLDQTNPRLGDEAAIDVEAVWATVEGEVRLMVADFAVE